MSVVNHFLCPVRTVEPVAKHLPKAGTPGEVIGFDLKTVTPLDAERWVMLLAVCFSCNKVWAWDLDIGTAKLETVQAILLRFFAEHEKPVVSWSDNGGQFRNTISDAIHQLLGVRPRFIPPSRPQANGIVECQNRVLDLSHGGCRDRLLSAAIAHNNKVNPKLGISPETAWRTLRPLESRWCSMRLDTAIHGSPSVISDGEWVQYLDESLAAKQIDPKAFADEVHAKVQPIRDAIGSAHLRADMANRLKAHPGGHPSSHIALLSGDRVIAKNKQYRTKTGGQKFECSQVGVNEYRVVANNGAIIEVEDLSTGRRMLKHEANLKLLPKALAPADILQPEAPAASVAKRPAAAMTDAAASPRILKRPVLAK